MLGKLFTSPVLTFASTTPLQGSYVDITLFVPNVGVGKLNSSHGKMPRAWMSLSAPTSWKLHSTAQTKDAPLGQEETKAWEACREALVSFKLSVEDEDKILGKAFGYVHSPYWGEEREKEVPRLEVVNEMLDFLRSLGLSDDDLGKLLKKFPEVLGCNLNEEVRNNVQILNDTWSIKGKSLRNLLLRNPKVLGYTVDCKGDCVAKCTRCWVRF